VEFSIELVGLLWNSKNNHQGGGGKEDEIAKRLSEARRGWVAEGVIPIRSRQD
jgi:hypothetical protein